MAIRLLMYNPWKPQKNTSLKVCGGLKIKNTVIIDMFSIFILFLQEVRTRCSP